MPWLRWKYNGKTERHLISGMNKYGKRNTEPMFKQLSEWQMFKKTCTLYALLSVYNEDD